MSEISKPSLHLKCLLHLKDFKHLLHLNYLWYLKSMLQMKHLKPSFASEKHETSKILNQSFVSEMSMIPKSLNQLLHLSYLQSSFVACHIWNTWNICIGIDTRDIRNKTNLFDIHMQSNTTPPNSRSICLRFYQKLIETPPDRSFLFINNYISYDFQEDVSFRFRIFNTGKL